MATYKRQSYLLMSIDPVHVGSGGYRLGRVDNSIVREPGSRVPKIPGTSLHGAAKSYAAHLYGDICSAGRGQRNRSNYADHPIYYTFGYSPQEDDTGTQQNSGSHSSSGVINVFDAHVVFFPVHSMAGPVWVTTAERLAGDDFDAASQFQATGVSGDALPEIGKHEVRCTWQKEDRLNLGWLMLDTGTQVSVAAPEKWQAKRWNAIKDRIVLVSEGLFSHVVNSNLEIRTSVSIDPQRGAAEDGALFTYEALPRATFLRADAVLDDYRDGNKSRPFPVKESQKGTKLAKAWNDPLDVFRAGLGMVRWLGVGGMGTRGFGRIAIVADPIEHGIGEG